MIGLQRGRLEEPARLKWLRRAVKKGIDQIDRGDVREFDSIDELDRHIEQLGAESAAGRRFLSPGGRVQQGAAPGDKKRRPAPLERRGT